jgi:serine/threonine protein kinase
MEDLSKKLEELDISDEIEDLSLDNFDLSTTVGTGSFGRVRIAKIKDNDKPYALKMLKKSEIIRLK